MSDEATPGTDQSAPASPLAAEHESHPLFLPVVFVGGFVFGIGLAVSQMARPEIVLAFLQLQDLGLLFVMGGASVVVAFVVWALVLSGESAPLTGTLYSRRLKTLDRNALLGGGIFGIGWGLSGICPGAAYASLGIGNVVMLYGVAGMLLGAYLQGHLRSKWVDEAIAVTSD